MQLESDTCSLEDCDGAAVYHARIEWPDRRVRNHAASPSRSGSARNTRGRYGKHHRRGPYGSSTSRTVSDRSGVGVRDQRNASKTPRLPRRDRARTTDHPSHFTAVRSRTPS